MIDKNYTIDIGDTRYQVRFVDRVGPWLSNVMGEFLGYRIRGRCEKYMFYDFGKISVQKKLGPKAKRHVLFHEISHGICMELRKKYPRFQKFNNDEEFIDDFAEVLSSVFNVKRVRKWKRKKKKKEK